MRNVNTPSSGNAHFGRYVFDIIHPHPTLMLWLRRVSADNQQARVGALYGPFAAFSAMNLRKDILFVPVNEKPGGPLHPNVQFIPLVSSHE